ncbi:MAG: HlyD family secretion protein, partial [Acidobacteria bacterium]|nr:HlyD family secretion protein [Acidobacteriota bacterium]
SASQYFAASVETGPLRNVVNATGVVQTVVTVQVGSQVSGQVEELYADYNSVVKRGQLLAKLDPRNFQAQVENSTANVVAAQARVRSGEAEQKTQAANLLSSKANLEAARVTRDNTAILFERASELSKSGVASKNDYDNAKANADSAQAKYEQAQAAVAQVEAQSSVTAAQLEQVKAQLQQAQADFNRSQLNLEYCSIYSPVDGVVISRNVDVGQTIAASMQAPTLFTIANDLTRMQVNANVDEADIGSISDQAGVRFTVDAYPNDVFRGRISEIRLNPQTIQNVVTYNVIIGIENPEIKLKPGMTANITITIDQRDSALKVANAALRYTPPGMKREELGGQRGAFAPPVPPPAAPRTAEDRDSAPVQLAPGQKWNPSEKIRTAPPRRTVNRPALVYVLNAEQKPEPRKIMVGITDGSATEVVAGELKEGESAIIGDSTQSASAPQPNAPLPPLLGGLRGFGGGGGRGRGN